MSEPKDKSLYEKVKKSVFKRIPVNSAYRSGVLVQEYKKEYKKKHGNNDSYIGKKDQEKGLSRWFESKSLKKNRRGLKNI